MVEHKPVKRLNGSGNRQDWNADEWAGAIKESWQKAVASIVQTGKLLKEAKLAMRHGAWGDMVEKKLPFGDRTAQILIAIGEHRVISNPKFISVLPPSWGCLYELTKLPEEELESLIAAGKIRSEMRRADVVEIIKRHREEGLYLFARAFQSMNTLVKFMRKWPDASGFAERAFDDMEESENAPDLGDLPKISQWLADVHAALVAEREQREQAFQAAEDAEREMIDARVAAMTDKALKEFADNPETPLTARNRARAEAQRRDLGWHGQSAASPKKKPKAKNSPGPDDVIVRDGKITFREPREIAAPEPECE